MKQSPCYHYTSIYIYIYIKSKWQWPIRQYYILYTIFKSPQQGHSFFYRRFALKKPSSSRGFQDAPSLVALQQTAPSLRTALQAGLLEANLDMSMLAEKVTDDTNMESKWNVLNQDIGNLWIWLLRWIDSCLVMFLQQQYVGWIRLSLS